MANPRYSNIIPLGKITVTTAGTPVALSINCGPLGGQIGTSYQSPPLPGIALRQMVLTALAANTLMVYLLPRGYTKNDTGLIIAALNPGQTLSLPQGFLAGESFLPENFVVDADTSGSIIFGCGFPG